MEWYYVWWPWLTYKRVAQVFQHQLSLLFPSVLWRTLLVGWQEGHPACKRNWVLVCWWWRFDWSFARPIAPVLATMSVTLSSNEIQNVRILVPANPCPPGKGPLKRRDIQQWSAKTTVVPVCVLVLLRLFGGGLAALSKLPRSFTQTLYLLLRLRTTHQDGHARQATCRLLLALSRNWTQTVSMYTALTQPSTVS